MIYKIYIIMNHIVIYKHIRVTVYNLYIHNSIVIIINILSAYIWYIIM